MKLTGTRPVKVMQVARVATNFTTPGLGQTTKARQIFRRTLRATPLAYSDTFPHNVQQ